MDKDLQGIDSISAGVQAQQERFRLADDILGGTEAMRKAGILRLPRFEAEKQENYQIRLSKATLTNYVGQTIDIMAGKPFSKPMKRPEKPSDLVSWLDNVNQLGTNIETYFHDVMKEILGYGMCGTLVEYPQTPQEVKTQADKNKSNLRPYLVFYTHKQIIGAKLGVMADGTSGLTQVRLSETAEVQKTRFETEVVERIRVLEYDNDVITFEVYEKQDHGYTLIESGYYSNINRIPFVFHFADQETADSGRSPLLDQMFSNVLFWQKKSDIDNILTYATRPLMIVTGMKKQNGDQFVLGQAGALLLPEEADAKYLEVKGNGIGLAEENLKRLEEQMSKTGAQLILESTTNTTATESQNKAEQNKSKLLVIVERLEDSIDNCLQVMADYENLGEVDKVSLYKDFGASSINSDDYKQVLEMLQLGVISKETAIREAQRRAIVSPEINPDEETETALLETELDAKRTDQTSNKPV